MNDEQLAAQLRSAERPVTPDPAFLDRLYQDLAIDLGFRAEDRPGPAPVRAGRRRRGRIGRYGPLLLAAAFVSLAALAAILVGSQRDDLRTAVGRAGTTRIAVRPDFPQADLGGLAGFDVDVARALMDKLALDAELEPVPVGQILTGSTTAWDLAMPSTVLTADEQTRFASTDAYYLWPVSLLVLRAGGAQTTGDLDGQRICAVTGSSGAAWLHGDLSSQVTVAARAPALPQVTVLASDADCMTALIAHDVDAMVTASWSPADLAARPSLRAVGSTAYLEPRSIIASRDPRDPTALLLAIDRALDELRADGTLSQLSGNRFGGIDLTTPPVVP